MHPPTHTPTPIYTHILTTTHKQNLNGILSHFRFSISFHLLNCLMNIVINFKKPYVAEKYFPWIKYIYIIYIYLLSLL